MSLMSKGAGHLLTDLTRDAGCPTCHDQTCSRGATRSCADLDDALAAGLPVLVTGESGAGKTALLATSAARTGRRVLEGGALSTLSWMEHLPLTRALGHVLAGTDQQAVEAEVANDVGDGVLVLDDLQWAAPAHTRCGGRAGRAHPSRGRCPQRRRRGRRRVSRLASLASPRSTSRPSTGRRRHRWLNACGPSCPRQRSTRSCVARAGTCCCCGSSRSRVRRRAA